jgi:hypothetical protein
MAFFRASTYWVLDNGISVLFWVDRWLLDHSLLELTPDLTVVVSTRCKNRRTVASTLQNDAWTRDITGALSILVILQFLQVKQDLVGIGIDSLLEDRLIWHWCPFGCYSSKSAYEAMFIGQSATFGAREFWCTRAPNKCRFYIWTMLHERCWTSERLHRNDLPNNGPCALCDQEVETVDHLLVGCSFSQKIWFKMLMHYGWSQATPAMEDRFIDWWLHSRKGVPKL